MNESQKQQNTMFGIIVILICMLLTVMFSSCQTVKEMNMSNNTKATQCAWFE